MIEERSAGARRGVGTTGQCVTGRLATIEVIVDWQPYDHVGWRLAVPGVGPVDATVDLDAVDSGTRVRLRWAAGGPGPADTGRIALIAREKRAALDRLATLLDAGGRTEAAQEARR